MPRDDDIFGGDMNENPFSASGSAYGSDKFPGQEDDLEAAAPNNSSFAPSNASAGGDDLSSRERQLAAREAELQRREQHLANKASKLDSQGRIKNWPFPCWTIAYHSIADDIMDRYKGLMRQFYVLWLSLQVTTLWNWVCIVAMAGGGTKHNLSWPGAADAIFATVYLFAVPFFSWRLWYRVWYNWCKKGKGHFMWFSLWYFIHLAWTIAMLVGVPTGAGMLVMFDQYAGDEGLMGTFTLISCGLWGLHLLYGLFLYKRAHMTWKTSGVDDYVREQAKQAAKKQLQAEAKKEFGGAQDGW